MNEVLSFFMAMAFVINMFSTLILALDLLFEYNNNPPLFVQQHLWKELDHKDINFIGKLILCILITPFTIMYTVAILGVNIGSFLLASIWKLFCLLFKKR